MSASPTTLKSLAQDVVRIVWSRPLAQKRPVSQDEYAIICAMVASTTIVSLFAVQILWVSLSGPLWTMGTSGPERGVWVFSDRCSDLCDWDLLLGMLGAVIFHYRAFGKSISHTAIITVLILLGSYQSLGFMIQVSHDPSQNGEAILCGVGTLGAQLVLRKALQNIELPPLRRRSS